MFLALLSQHGCHPLVESGEHPILDLAHSLAILPFLVRFMLLVDGSEISGTAQRSILVKNFYIENVVLRLVPEAYSMDINSGIISFVDCAEIK